MTPIKSTRAHNIVAQNIDYGAKFLAKEYQVGDEGYIPASKAFEAIICAEQDAEMRHAQANEHYESMFKQLCFCEEYNKIHPNNMTSPSSDSLIGSTLTTALENIRCRLAADLFIKYRFDPDNKYCVIEDIIHRAVEESNILVSELKKTGVLPNNEK